MKWLTLYEDYRVVLVDNELVLRIEELPDGGNHIYIQAKGNPNKIFKIRVDINGEIISKE